MINDKHTDPDMEWWLAIEKKFPWLKLYGWTYQQTAHFIYGDKLQYSLQVNNVFRDLMITETQPPVLPPVE